MLLDRASVEAGGLMAYFPETDELWWRVVGQVDLIPRGRPVAEIPWEEPTKFELVVNLQTARALGSTVPPALAALADEVIE